MNVSPVKKKKQNIKISKPVHFDWQLRSRDWRIMVSLGLPEMSKKKLRTTVNLICSLLPYWSLWRRSWTSDNHVQPRVSNSFNPLTACFWTVGGHCWGRRKPMHTLQSMDQVNLSIQNKIPTSFQKLVENKYKVTE